MVGVLLFIYYYFLIVFIRSSPDIRWKYSGMSVVRGGL